jgi:hypothetical protein
LSPSGQKATSAARELIALTFAKGQQTTETNTEPVVTEAALPELFQNRKGFLDQETRKIAAHSQLHQHLGYDKHRADQGL